MKKDIKSSKKSSSKIKEEDKKLRATPELKVKENKKTTINDEIIFCITNNILITISLLSKRAGVSVHRVRKYCQSNYIDLDKININNYLNMLDKKRVSSLKRQEKKQLEEQKMMLAKNKQEDKLKKSLEKKNSTSSKHKMPIQIADDKLTLSFKESKMKFDLS